VADSQAVLAPRVWDIAGKYGKRSLVLHVPGTYPPSPINGTLVSCFLTPPDADVFTHPPALSARLQAIAAGQVTGGQVTGGRYPFDVTDFRSPDKARIAAELEAITRTHFEAARQLVRESAWDLFIMVEIGVDRVHHAFWSDMDESHHRYQPGSPYTHTIRDYLRLVDAEIGSLLAAFDDDTLIFVVSDHGARRMDGGICLNEWLIARGYLRLKGDYPLQPNVRLIADDIDWAHTRAWGDGGYYGRVWINRAGREPHGIVAPEAYAAFRAQLASELEALGDETGSPLGTRAFTPETLYRTVNGVAPDLLVYFGDLAWRSIGTIGWQRIHVRENDSGPDDANHAQHGIFIAFDPRRDLGGRELHGLQLQQLAPTLLRALGVPVPETWAVQPIAWDAAVDAVATAPGPN
jgi:predicted AlkP superfamily phosphohydrolase/phosphomutase